MVTGDFFNNVKTIAIVGLSDDPSRPSNEVARYLKSEGFRIIPVNPLYKELLGEKAYPNLLSIPRDVTIDVVDIFRRSEDVMPHVKEAVQRGDAHTLWLQEGITNHEAEEFARNNGMTVYANFCLMKAHRKSEA
jgi:predicted CoA-binding protein